ncbi:MAG: metal ABC transporter substrate-binding protein [Ilumatobacteraceae bacterium]
MTVLASLVFVAACGTSEDGSLDAEQNCIVGSAVTGRPVRVVSTVAPITSLIAQIVGDTGVTVTGLVPEGTNSHTFEPPPSAAQVLESADVVFMNGLVLEEPTKDLAQANVGESTVLCELGTRILPQEEWVFDFSFPEEGGKPNPHLWTNPPMAKSYAEIIRDVLSQLDPSNASAFESNYAALASIIDDLDAAMKRATETISSDRRLLLTYHDAYAYFAKHYNWTVVGAIQPSSFDEPTPKDVAELVAQVREREVPAVFGSEVFPSSVLEQIGNETGARYVDVLRDDDLPGKPGDADHSWQALMRFNFVTMVEALGGDATSLKSLDISLRSADRAEYPQ